MTLALKQTNRDWLERTLLSVSDPDSPNYGHHMSLEEIAKYVHGYPEGVAKVKEVLGAIGVQPSFTIGEGFAIADIPVSVAENLFSATFYKFQHREYKNLTTIRSTSHSIPTILSPYISFVSGLSEFPKVPVKKPIKALRDDGNSVGDVTPDFIDKSYNVQGYVSKNVKNSQAVAGFLSQFFSPEDLKEFQQQFKLPLKPIVKIVGENDGSNQGIEANLDVQYISAIGRNVDTWFYSVTSRANGNQEDFLTWVLELANSTDVPWVHSASYGDKESSIDTSFMNRVEEEFMKLGLSGRTLIFASGDSGTSCSIFNHGVFEPTWPASSPYVTTVGGTISMTECWDHSGGGFSNVHQMPSYQRDAVNTYLKSGAAPDTKYFNTSGRAYPDLAVFSINFDIIYVSIPWPVDGTSCSAPTTAGLISLLNDVRLNAGLGTLGFMNPLIYKLKGNGFFDITKVRYMGRI